MLIKLHCVVLVFGCVACADDVVFIVAVFVYVVIVVGPCCYVCCHCLSVRFMIIMRSCTLAL